MKKVYDFLNDFLHDGNTIVIGCSGGADSMCLLNVLIDVRKQKDIKIVVGHVNHNVRSVSASEEEFVSNWCLEHDVIFESMTILEYGDDNFENEARTIRYRFFDDLIKKYKANYLMTAHHGDDLIETVMMRIVRGSTLKGYSGFNQIVLKDDYQVVRPLIYTTKKEIEEYDKNNNIPYVVDLTNFDDIHTRNRYRKNVLPFLKSEDINVHEKFIKFSKTLQKYDDFISKLVSSYYCEVFHDNCLDINNYLKYDDIIKEKIIYMILEKIYSDDLILINDKHVSLINDLIISKKKNSFIYLPNNIKVVKEYDNLLFIFEENQFDNYEIELSDYVSLPNGHILEVVSECSTNGNDICRLNSSDICLPLRVRTRRLGDKMSLKGSNGHKKVKDILIEAKIPMKDREMWPVVVDSHDEIIFIPGLKKSKFAKSKTENCDIIVKYY